MIKSMVSFSFGVSCQANHFVSQNFQRCCDLHNTKHQLLPSFPEKHIFQAKAPLTPELIEITSKCDQI